MDRIIELIEKIEEVRKRLNSLTGEKGNLIDPEIKNVSEMLDKLLNEYYKLCS